MDFINPLPPVTPVTPTTPPVNYETTMERPINYNSTIDSLAFSKTVPTSPTPKAGIYNRIN